jgi:hypothetical protein
MSNTATSSNEEGPIRDGAASTAPWFAAMEYHTLILNRTYKVFVTDQMLCGAKVRGLVASPMSVPVEMFDPAFWVRTRAARIYDRLDVTSETFLNVSSANFQIKWNEIDRTEYRSGWKWGMGNVAYSGWLTLHLRAGCRRELILLGRQNGEALKARFDQLI